MGFLSQFWRGELGFMPVIAGLLGVSGLMRAGLAVLPIGLVLGAIAVLSLVSLWQIVGGIRFAERVIRDGATSRVWGAYAGVIAAVFLNLSGGITLLLPQPEMSLEIRGQNPKITVLGNVAVVSGEIEYRVLTELKEAVAVRTIDVVRLRSTGGNVIAGRSIGLFVAREGMNTEVLEHCYSACTLAFMGGVRRVLGPDAALGFHGYRIDTSFRVQLIDWQKIVAKDRAFLADQGVDARFVDRIFETPPEHLWQPDRAVLSAAGVLR